MVKHTVPEGSMSGEKVASRKNTWMARNIENIRKLKAVAAWAAVFVWNQN